MTGLAINGAIEHIEKSSYALLVTVGDDGKPAVREIGPFINSGLDIYFVTRNDSHKVKEFTNRPHVTLYFPNTNLPPKDFKTAAVSGTVARISSEAEMHGILDKLGQKSPGYKNYIAREGLNIWGVYKMTAENLQCTDFSKSTRTVKLLINK